MGKVEKLFASFLDTLLRKITIMAAILHHRLTTSRKMKYSYIPASGKLIGEAEITNMIEASLDKWLTAGRFCDAFEKKLSEFLGLPYCLAVNSGSSANLLAVFALMSPQLKDRRLMPGDEVISVAAGFPATISPIIHAGLVPVFVDVDIHNGNLVTLQLERAYSPKIKAIFLAHTLGNPFDIKAIMAFAKQYNLWVIEDNCDAFGATVDGQLTGTFGDISTVSFYPAHQMTIGEGGAVFCRERVLHNIIMSFRDWGRDCWCAPGCDNTCQNRFQWSLGSLPKGYDHKYIYSHLGFNLKITDWQAAIGLAQLDRLPEFINKRCENFDSLYAKLSPFEKFFNFPTVQEGVRPSWFGFLLSVKPDAPFSRLDAVKFLEEHGVGTRQLFSGNFLRHPACTKTRFPLRILDSELLYSDELSDAEFRQLPGTEYMMHHAFWVGVWPGLASDECHRMSEVIEKLCKGPYE